MGDPLSVRTAREGDLSRIAELEDLLFEGTGFNRATLMQLFVPSGATWLVAEDGEDIWGYSLTVRAIDDSGTAWILALEVHPERQGRHVGRRLLDESILELQSKGIRTIKLTVMSLNKSAYEMYIGAGFQDTGQWKDGDLGDGERHKILTLLLPVT